MRVCVCLCVTQCVYIWRLAHAYANPPFPNRVRRSDTIKLLQPLFVLENKSTSRLLMLLLSSGPVIVLNLLHLKRKGFKVFPQARSVSWALKFPIGFYFSKSWPWKWPKDLEEANRSRSWGRKIMPSEIQSSLLRARYSDAKNLNCKGFAWWDFSASLTTTCQKLSANN